MACLPANAHLEISTRHRGPTWVLGLAGDLDVNSTDQLRAAITGVLRHDPQLLVLDLSELEYADCAGLSVMVWAHRALASRQRSLRVTGCRGAVQRLMHLTGTDLILRQARATTRCPG